MGDRESFKTLRSCEGVSYKGSGLGRDGIPLHNLNSVMRAVDISTRASSFIRGNYADRHVFTRETLSSRIPSKVMTVCSSDTQRWCPDHLGNMGSAAIIFIECNLETAGVCQSRFFTFSEFTMDARLGERVRERYDGQHAPDRRSAKPMVLVPRGRFSRPSTRWHWT